jgi:CRP-like cAMP-binding protein
MSHLLPQTDMVRWGQDGTKVILLAEGFAVRYKVNEDGRRQVIGLMVPGDFCDLQRDPHWSVHGSVSYLIKTVSFATVVVWDSKLLERLGARSPKITEALQWCTLIDEAITREWVINVGCRNAHQRMAHFFTEVFLRLFAVGLVQGSTCRLPLTQKDLAEVLGLSPVHANRTLQKLRGGRSVTMRSGLLTVHDLPRLQAEAMFVADYLLALVRSEANPSTLHPFGPAGALFPGGDFNGNLVRPVDRLGRCEGLR